MLNVLIADDERIIREGLAFGVDWRSLNMNIVGLACDGKEAYNKIIESEPDIVIIDIRMPEMTGLEVIEAVREKLGDKITFIILSGYNEFSYAQQGISYGVVEYLLKPTDDELLLKTLKKVGERTEREKRRLDFENTMRKNMERQMPILREHLAKDYITNSYFEAEDFEYYKKYLDLDSDVRLILYQIANETSIEELFSLKSLITQKIDSDSGMCLSIRNQLLIILKKNYSDHELSELLTDINKYFHNFYDSNLHVIYTGKHPFKIIPYIYAQANKCTGYSFYLSDEYIVSMEDILDKIDTSYDAHFTNYDEIIDCINIGNVEMTKQLINAYFENLSNARFAVHITKTYLTELYMGILRCADEADADKFISETLAFSQAGTLDEIKEQILRLALTISENNYNEIADSSSKNIEQAIKYVNEHLSDYTLTLKYLCNNILFVNPDYFGRLFKRETGEKFTRYVTSKRIDAAKKLIAKGKHSISEIAEMVGFGDGAQYFSQVFRKLTGYTPSEYREKGIFNQEQNQKNI